VTTLEPQSLNRFRLLATYIAGRGVDIAASADSLAYTDGRVIFVSPDAPPAVQRREAVVQSALLGATSLDSHLVTALRARPTLARRYLALEGHRVLFDLGVRLPLVAWLRNEHSPRTATPDESLEMARGRGDIADPPDWFGAIKPSRLLGSPAAASGRANDRDLRLIPEGEVDSNDEDNSEQSRILKLFETPLSSSPTFANFLRKLFGTSRSPGDRAPGGELQAGSARRTHNVDAIARPRPTPIRFIATNDPGATLGISGTLHPEWDVFANRYRPDWCRVVDFSLTAPTDVADAGMQDDGELRRRMARIGLGPQVLRGRADGDELDLEALVDLFVDLRSGYSTQDRVYTERRKLSRDLGVLILVDASGSATDTDPDGLAVHDHQRRAAATIAATLEELGDRVALYAFRSHGRHAVHLAAIKTFEQRFGAAGRARLHQLQPSGYTRLGAGIRGAGEILKNQSGTPNRLLIVLSDAFPYDVDYEGRYAEADANSALDELRVDGVASLCLSIGAGATTSAVKRVFGSTGHACAASLADLSPRMDELFLSSLRELAASRPHRP
jgi:nitric oxide reductase NorD protein